MPRGEYLKLCFVALLLMLVGLASLGGAVALFYLGIGFSWAVFLSLLGASALSFDAVVMTRLIDTSETKSLSLALLGATFLTAAFTSLLVFFPAFWLILGLYTLTSLGLMVLCVCALGSSIEKSSKQSAKKTTHQNSVVSPMQHCTEERIEQYEADIEYLMNHKDKRIQKLAETFKKIAENLDFKCPISQALMRDPVSIPSNGTGKRLYFEQEYLVQWYQKSPCVKGLKRNPLDRGPFTLDDMSFEPEKFEHIQLHIQSVSDCVRLLKSNGSIIQALSYLPDTQQVTQARIKLEKAERAISAKGVRAWLFRRRRLNTFKKAQQTLRRIMLSPQTESPQVLPTLPVKKTLIVTNNATTKQLDEKQSLANDNRPNRSCRMYS